MFYYLLNCWLMLSTLWILLMWMGSIGLALFLRLLQSTYALHPTIGLSRLAKAHSIQLFSSFLLLLSYYIYHFIISHLCIIVYFIICVYLYLFMFYANLYSFLAYILYMYYQIFVTEITLSIEYNIILVSKLQ